MMPEKWLLDLLQQIPDDPAHCYVKSHPAVNPAQWIVGGWTNYHSCCFQCRAKIKSPACQAFLNNDRQPIFCYLPLIAALFCFIVPLERPLLLRSLQRMLLT